jgi:catechol 2,3-dioxygenase-like lactoylglutathione lyase family enzyme
VEPRLTLVTLGVRDLAQSLRFYRDGLGWPVASEADNVAFIRVGGVILSLYPWHLLAEDAGLPAGEGASADAFPGFTLAHNVASKELVDQVLAAAVDAGARLVKPAVDVFWGGYSGYFADPDGCLWEVAWNPGWPLRADGSVVLPE